MITGYFIFKQRYDLFAVHFIFIHTVPINVNFKEAGEICPWNRSGFMTSKQALAVAQRTSQIVRKSVRQPHGDEDFELKKSDSGDAGKDFYSHHEGHEDHEGFGDSIFMSFMRFMVEKGIIQGRENILQIGICFRRRLCHKNNEPRRVTGGVHYKTD